MEPKPKKHFNDEDELYQTGPYSPRSLLEHLQQYPKPTSILFLGLKFKDKVTSGISTLVIKTIDVHRAGPVRYGMGTEQARPAGVRAGTARPLRASCLAFGPSTALRAEIRAVQAR